MRSKEIIATIAVVGAVATFAVLNMNQPQGESLFRLDSPYTPAFQNFIHKFGRRYGTKEEYKHRMKIFIDSYHEVMDHNSMNEISGYKKGINQFSDMSDHEFKKYLGLLNINNDKSMPTYEGPLFEPSNLDVVNLDWVAKGAVTSVKNQAKCGSCWAFSAIGALEGAYQLSGQTLTDFSEQQLVDCSHEIWNGEANNGCGGGWMVAAFDYLKTHKSEKLTDYPYHAKDETCAYDDTKGVVNVKSYVDMQNTKTTQELIDALKKGPVSVAIQAVPVLKSYQSGIISDKNCGSDLDHGVLLVGMGVDEFGNAYWKIKNSWDTTWGEKGYGRIRMTNDDNGPGLCGIKLAPAQPYV